MTDTRFNKVIDDNGRITYKPLYILNHPTLNDGLVSFWSFNNNIFDLAGLNDATNYGATFVDGLIGKCLSYDGVNDYTDTNLVMTGDDFTFAFWVKTSSTIGANRQTIFRERASSIDGLYVFFDTDGTFYCINERNNVQVILNTTNRYDDSEWYFIVYTEERNGTASLYINNELKDSASVSNNSLNYGTTTLTIGYDAYNSDEFYAGLFGLFGIYNRALTSKERTDLYNNGKGITFFKE